MTSLVHKELAGGIATITLDSPPNRNALSVRLLGDLETPAELGADRAGRPGDRADRRRARCSARAPT